ncbi:MULTISPECIES: hypothetical protein [Paenibacillus]|uniref:Uncharacterized protein n=1 Tax=Paenibacillus albilobatus TaxID=2716884 RepID=A0A919XKB5_9BACL|nr:MULTISPECIES: hypothetical protein [Paenibacillus]GIO32045.1 hypothetical protein J2TS6_31860 [Paenibacillus albilobatus]
MKANKKAKWIIGVSGVAFSAFVLSQFGTGEHNAADVQNNSQVEQQETNPSFNGFNEDRFTARGERPFTNRRQTDGTTRRS